MHSQPHRQLQNLLRHYGPGLLADPQRTEALLSDLCGEYEMEIFVLVHAQRSGILVELGRMAGQRADSALRQRLARRLQDRYAFSVEAAAWAVDGWADALDVGATPLYQSGSIALWHIVRGWVMALLRPKQAGREPGRKPGRKPGQKAGQKPSREPAYRASTVRAKRAPSIFSRIGVQWRRQSAWLLPSLVLVVVLVGAAGVAVQSGWLGLDTLGFEAQATAVEDSWQPLSPSGAATALAVRYPPPLEARIEADLLNVRSAPDLNADVLGKVGPIGATVTVDRFNEDGEWSHIGAPVAGWISNEYVTFAGLYVRPALGQVIQAGSVIRSEPRVDAPATETLVAGQTLVFVALSADGQWRQVVEPSPGWVESRAILLMKLLTKQ